MFQPHLRRSTTILRQSRYFSKNYHSHSHHQYGPEWIAALSVLGAAAAAAAATTSLEHDSSSFGTSAADVVVPHTVTTCYCEDKPKISIAIHGGAGTLRRSMMTTEKEQLYLDALKQARDAGYKLLENGGSAMDAVETAVRHLEDSPLFNAGRGSVFTHDGKHEMDASIMEGSERKAGAVCLVSNIKNPISLARMVMERSGHVFLAGEGAMKFARDSQAEMADDGYFYDEYRYQQWQQAQKSKAVQLDHTPLNEKKYGTVGAVALDAEGNLAAATSTGGMTNKRFGRVGDSPMIGSGTYANNATCAVSCTGNGEYFIRGVVAYDVSSMMEFGGNNLQDACEQVVMKRLRDLGGDGGLIAVNQAGEIVMRFNTEGMYRAARSSQGVDEVSIYA